MEESHLNYELSNSDLHTMYDSGGLLYSYFFEMTTYKYKQVFYFSLP